MFDHLKVETLPTDMSFAASMDGGSFEYSGSGLVGLFAQPTNIVRPRFWRMVSDIKRFYAEGRELLKRGDADKLTLRDMVEDGGYGKAFVHDHLLPMAAAIWSTPVDEMFDHPAAAFLKFCDNHGLMQMNDRPAWRTVKGGGREYVARLVEDGDFDIRTGCDLNHVTRKADGVVICHKDGREETFDHVVMACHADTALSLLDDPIRYERDLLSRFSYQPNRAVLHRDPSLMPRAKRAWSSWNYIGDATKAGEQALTVTYWMNQLQSLDEKQPLFVTLNPHREPDPSQVVVTFDYDHPVFTTESYAAQKRLWDLQGPRRTWFCGAYFGAGFHEDGLQSGLAVAEALGGVPRPWKVAEENGRIFVHAPGSCQPAKQVEAAE
jgi:predicted NAD/FAD-binding protein